MLFVSVGTIFQNQINSVYAKKEKVQTSSLELVCFLDSPLCLLRATIKNIVGCVGVLKNLFVKQMVLDKIC